MYWKCDGSTKKLNEIQTCINKKIGIFPNKYHWSTLIFGVDEDIDKNIVGISIQWNIMLEYLNPYQVKWVTGFSVLHCSS